jgi:hypothetical protein
MNDIRLRGLVVAGYDAAGRRSSHNHAQTVRNLTRSLRNAAAGARLIQAEGNSRSAADVAASLADALEELHPLSGALIDALDATNQLCGLMSRLWFETTREKVVHRRRCGRTDASE